MSNFIKSKSVTINEIKTKTIDTHIRKEAEISIKRKESIARLSKEHFDKADEVELAHKILEDAKRDAERLLSDAITKAEDIKHEAFIESSKNGYEDGINKANQEILIKLKQLQEKEDKLNNEYETNKKELEPKFVSLTIELLEKLTGIIAEDYQDIILYLINNAINNINKSDKYLIKVSSFDYKYVNDNKEYFIQDISNSHFDIKIDPNLVKNQCIIETNSQISDCSLSAQLENLKTSLKMLSKI
ncbi:MAG TPA: hypothetical protein GXZ90_09430 [Clostridiales bacterium]|nr:hypothetical protein [Clostridiales bacterium]